MSNDDPNLKRMGITLVLVIYVLVINTCQAVFLNIEEVDLSADIDNYESSREFESYGGNLNVSGFDAFGAVISFVTFFFGGFIAAIASFPLWMILILTPIYLISILGFWLLVFDYIKDISILGSNV